MPVQPSECLSNSRIKVIFNLVVCSPFQLLADLGPTVAKLVVEFEQSVLLLLGPIGVVDARVELIVPSEFMTEYL